MKLPSSPSNNFAGQTQFIAIATTIVVAAGFLRVYRIGRQELWLDEAYSFLLGTAPDWFGPATFSNNSPPLYHFLLRLWMAVAGDSEVALRLPSAIVGSLFVVALIWGGRIIFNPAVGLWSGGIAAVSPFHVYYSQEVRAYAALSFTLMLTFALIAHALRKNTWPQWVLVSCSALLALYSHHLAVLGLLPTILLMWALVSEPATDQKWFRYKVAMGCAFLVYLPWVVGSLILARHGMENPFAPYLQRLWESIPPSLAVPKSLEVLGLGGQVGLATTLVKQYVSFPRALRSLGVVVLLVLGLVAALPFWEKRVELPILWKRKLWLWVSLFFPLTVFWVISYFVKPMYIVGRYEIVCLPAYTLLLGLACTKIQRIRVVGQVLVIALIAALGVAVITKLVAHYKAPPYFAYEVPASSTAQDVANFLDTVVADGDVVVFSGGQWYSVLYYLDRLGYTRHDGVCEQWTRVRHFACRLFPTEVEKTFAFTSLDMVSTRQVLETDLESILAPISGRIGTIWVAFDAVPTADGLWTLNELDYWLDRRLSGEGYRPRKVAERFRSLVAFRRP